MLGLAQAQESAHNKVKPIEALLSRFTVAENGCHVWSGSTNGKGYGVMLLGGGTKDKKVLLLAHRLQWMHHNGPLERGVVIMHRCDNTRCIRIDHLQAGTQLENMADMIAKGRHNYSGLRNSAESAQNQAHRKAPTMTTDWQPIETAPLNQHVLVYVPSYDYSIGVGTQFTAPALIYVCEQCELPHNLGRCWTEAGGEQWATYEPTHWMPLPSPPAVGS